MQMLRLSHAKDKIRLHLQFLQTWDLTQLIANWYKSTATERKLNYHLQQTCHYLLRKSNFNWLVLIFKGTISKEIKSQAHGDNNYVCGTVSSHCVRLYHYEENFVMLSHPKAY